MRSRSRVSVGAVVLAFLFVGAPGARAHHGWSGYDSSTTLALTGVIKASGYEHPHGYVSP